MVPEDSESLSWGRPLSMDLKGFDLRVTGMLGQMEKWAVTGSYEGKR